MPRARSSFIPTVCGYAELGRAGLGNTLFPWARCLLWCERHGVPMLAPQWFRIRVGPYLRRERDKRAYHLIFRGPGVIDAARRAVCLLGMPRRPEPASIDSAPSASGVYVFEGMAPYFDPLRSSQRRLRQGLLDMVRPQLRPPSPMRSFIAVHVRRGDFSVIANDRKLREGNHSYRIATSWYVAALREDLPAVVFSDGHAREFKELIEESRTTVHTPISAATDLLIMSGATALVASGSSYSQWASFLGQIPTVWYPGQRRSPVLDEGIELEPEWELGPLPAPFGAAVRSRVLPAPADSVQADPA